MHIADLMPYATEQVQVKKHIGNLLDPTLAMSIVSVFERHEGSLLVICASAFDVLKLIDDIRCLNPAIDIKHFKDYETLPYDLPYDSLSPHQDIISSRLELLSTIGAKKELIICSVSTVMSRLCPVDYIVKKSFLLKVGDRRDISQLKSRLVEHGYVQVTQVLEHGEFALRGSILDIFPMGSDEPYRIDFFDDEVDSIATFDLESQRSVKKTQSIKLLPAHEFPLDEMNFLLMRRALPFSEADIVTILSMPICKSTLSIRPYPKAPYLLALSIICLCFLPQLPHSLTILQILLPLFLLAM